MSKLSKEIKEYISCPQINGKPYGRWGTLNSQQRIKIWNLAHQCEVFESVADDSVKELTKYKRAFEILKEKTGLEVKNVNNLGRILHKLYYGDDESTLEKEEYELLEELMNNENTK